MTKDNHLLKMIDWQDSLQHLLASPSQCHESDKAAGKPCQRPCQALSQVTNQL